MCNDNRFGEWRSQLFWRGEWNVNKVTHCHNMNVENRALFTPYSRRQQLIAIKLLWGNPARHPTIQEPSWITFMLVIHLVPPVYNSNTITREFIQRPEADQKNDSRRSRRSMYSDIIVVSGKSTGTIRNPPKQAPPNYKRINNTIDLYLKILPFHR